MNQICQEALSKVSLHYSFIIFGKGCTVTGNKNPFKADLCSRKTPSYALLISPAILSGVF